MPADCPGTFARRAGSATVSSPARTDNTIHAFSPAGTADGSAMGDQTPPLVRPAHNGPSHKT